MAVRECHSLARCTFAVPSTGTIQIQNINDAVSVLCSWRWSPIRVSVSGRVCPCTFSHGAFAQEAWEREARCSGESGRTSLYTLYMACCVYVAWLVLWKWTCVAHMYVPRREVGKAVLATDGDRAWTRSEEVCGCVSVAMLVLVW